MIGYLTLTLVAFQEDKLISEQIGNVIIFLIVMIFGPFIVIQIGIMINGVIK